MYHFAAVRPRNRLFILACLALLLTLLPWSAIAHAETTDPAPDGPWGQVPMWFTPLPAIFENGPQYEAVSTAGYFNFDLTGYTFTLTGSDNGDRTVVRMQFELGRAQELLAADRLTGGASGGDGSALRRNAPVFGRLIYEGLYPGIDLQYEGDPGRLKARFVVAAGADPANIQWRYNGAAAVEVGQPNGELWVRLPGERKEAHYLIGGAPVAWQEFGLRKTAIAAAYEVSPDGRVSFTLGKYDRSRPLIIDPSLSFAVIE